MCRSSSARPQVKPILVGAASIVLLRFRSRRTCSCSGRSCWPWFSGGSARGVASRLEFLPAKINRRLRCCASGTILPIVKRFVSLWCAIAATAISGSAQRQFGELHLQVVDPTGAGISASAELVSQAVQFRKEFSTDPGGQLVVPSLPF